jgi:hypothetical protein
MSEATTLPGLFEAQVARTPDAVALCFEGRERSYAQLDACTTRLARVFVSHGVGPERVVAVVLPHSDQLILAILAVAKAGGAFLPIDLRHPADRVRSIIADARPVLTLNSENIDALIAATADDPLPAVLSADQIAYAIYTSGTTGGPKGDSVCATGDSSPFWGIVTMAETVTDRFTQWHAVMSSGCSSWRSVPNRGVVEQHRRDRTRDCGCLGRRRCQVYIKPRRRIGWLWTLVRDGHRASARGVLRAAGSGGASEPRDVVRR